MSVFYHPFRENGNLGKSFLLNNKDDTIVMTGKAGLNIYPMLSGKIKSLSTSEITITSINCGYSKKTNQPIDIIYKNLIIGNNLTVGQEVNTFTVIGKLGDNTSPNFTINFQSLGNPISVTELYIQNKNNVPNYEILSKNTLQVQNSEINIPANDSYIKMIFAQKPSFSSITNASSTGLVAVAEAEMCEMLRNPQNMTGYARQGLGATQSNKYQKSHGISAFAVGHEAWCAAFVTWCANAAGYVDSGIWAAGRINGSCNNIIDCFNRRGNPERSHLNYTPVVGDLVFFQHEPDPARDHVGIVYRVSSDTIITIEGNVTMEPGAFQYYIERYISDTIIGETLREVCGSKSFYEYVASKYPIQTEINGVGVRAYSLNDPSIDCYIHLE